MLSDNFKANNLFLFETEHLLVREYTMGDADTFFLLNSNETVMRYIRPVKTREECDVFLAENVKQYKAHPGTGRWMVIEKATNQFIGTFSILIMTNELIKQHIGYAFMPEYWGKGYATEVLKAGIVYFFKERPTDTLYAITKKENTASEKVLFKCGFAIANDYAVGENLWTTTNRQQSTTNL